MEFHVCGLDTLRQDLAKFQPTHVLSVIEKEHTPDLSNFAWSVQDHKVVNFHDVFNPNAIGAPTKDDCAKIYSWIVQLPLDAKVLVHCMAGISRSTASMFMIILFNSIVVNPFLEFSEHLKIAKKKLVEVRKIAFPSPLMAKYFDELALAQGELVKTIEEIRKESPSALIFGYTYDED